MNFFDFVAKLCIAFVCLFVILLAIAAIANGGMLGFCIILWIIIFAAGAL